MKDWTAAEQQRLRLLYPDSDMNALKSLFGRTKQALYQRAYRLGLRRRTKTLGGKRLWYRPQWTVEEETTLRQNYGEFGTKLVAQLPGRSKFAIQRKAYALDLIRQPRRTHRPHASLAMHAVPILSRRLSTGVGE